MTSSGKASMLDAITPVILTNTEAVNIRRTLSHLNWAKEIVVVDSGSMDETLDILLANPRVRLLKRPLDSHSRQWRFATQETGITTPWLLRLDADYQLPQAFIEELAGLDPNGPECGYRVAFDYAVFARTLIASLYPPKTILLRSGKFAAHDDGHNETWTIDGPVGALKARVIHDDWKPMDRWLISQVSYMKRDLGKHKTRRSGVSDWLRRHPPLMPVVVFFYCLFGKGLILNGKAGLLYTLQRVIAESMLSLLMVEKALHPPADEKTKKKVG